MKIPSHDEVLAYFDGCSNWGRWGPDDQLGTLNLITPAKRLQAARLVSDGVVIPLGMDLDPANPDPLARDTEISRRTDTHMVGERIQATREIIEMQTHGSPTHIDAPSHMSWDGKLYNGLPISCVSAEHGAEKLGVENTRDGIVTRGVLLDIPAVRGVPWLGPGEAIFPEDLDAAEKCQGVRVEEGDFLIARTGFLTRVAAEGVTDKMANGYHAACLPWLHERGVAVISCDALNDSQPTSYGADIPIRDIPLEEHASMPSADLELALPIHCVALVAMGCWLVDNMVVDELLDACQLRNRWEFLIMMSPLRWVGASASQVNPLAVF